MKEINCVTEIVNEVKNIVSRILSVHEQEVLFSSRLNEDLGADSIDMVEIIMDCEKKFNISISEEEGSDVKRVEDVINLIEIKKLV
jgi:acyl carrier protein